MYMYEQPMYEPNYEQAKQNLDFINLLIASNYPREWFYALDENGEESGEILTDLEIEVIHQREFNDGEVKVKLPEDTGHPIYSLFEQTIAAAQAEQPDVPLTHLVHSYNKTLPLNASDLYIGNQTIHNESTNADYHILQIPINLSVDSSLQFETNLENHLTNLGVYNSSQVKVEVLPETMNSPDYNWVEHGGNFVQLTTVPECSTRTESIKLWCALQANIAYGLAYINGGKLVAVMSPFHFDPAPIQLHEEINRTHLDETFRLGDDPDAMPKFIGFRPAHTGSNYPSSSNFPNYFRSSWVHPVMVTSEAISNWSGSYGPYRLWKYVDDNEGDFEYSNKREEEVNFPSELMLKKLKYEIYTDKGIPNIRTGLHSVPPVKIDKDSGLDITVPVLDLYHSWKELYVRPLAKEELFNKVYMNIHQEYHRIYGLEYTPSPEVLEHIDIEGNLNDDEKSVKFTLYSTYASLAEWERVTKILATEIFSNMDYHPVINQISSNKGADGSFDIQFVVQPYSQTEGASTFSEWMNGTITVNFRKDGAV